MKKIVLCLMIGFLSLAFLPLQSKAASTEEPTSVPAPKPAESVEAKPLFLLLFSQLFYCKQSKQKSWEIYFMSLL
jgi:hypothetical protein